MDATAKLRKLLAAAKAGRNPEIHEAALAAGYVPGPGWTVHSTTDVARFFGVTVRRVQQWIAGGMPRRALPKRRYAYDLAEIAAWRHASVEAEARRGRQADDERKEELEKLRRVKREIGELQRDALKGDLVPREQVREGCAALARILRQACDRLARKYGAGAHRILGQAIDRYETELTRRFEG